MRAGVSRRRLLGAGVVGAGALLVAPRRSLVAVAQGLDRPVGLWSVVTDPRSGALVGLLDAGQGPEVRRLEVDDRGSVRVGPRLLDTVDLEPIAVGADGHPVVLGSRAAPPAASRPPDSTDASVRALLDAEPFGPALGIDGPVSPLGPRAATILDLATGGQRAVPTHGLVSAASGAWTIHQHGPDDEADHLPMLTVALGGDRRVLFDDLGLAGVAQLSGPPAAPVVAVADGTGGVRVRRLPGGPDATLADDLSVAVTATDHDVFATRRGPDGSLVIDRLDGAGWRAHRVIADTEVATAVVAVGRASAFVVTGPTMARLVSVGGGG